MKTILTTIGLMIAVGGCATVKESYAPDGRKAYALNCSGTARGWDKCLVAAGEQCGAAGYDVIDRNTENTAGISATKTGLIGIQSSERTMLVACKRPQ